MGSWGSGAAPSWGRTRRRGGETDTIKEGSDTLLVKNARLFTNRPGERIVADGCVQIEDGVVVYAGPRDTAMTDSSDAVLDAGGRLCMPGMICAHGHFYGSLSRGIPLKDEPPAAFIQILERLWWRLDAALGPEDVRASAEVALLDALRAGTTTVIDHHASPGCRRGSLDIVAEAAERAGVRTGLCYEVSDRHGEAGGREGVEENLRMARNLRTGRVRPLLASCMGLHASFTLSDETLARAAEGMRELGLLPHLHAAEGIEDQADALRRGDRARRVVYRLESAGVLTPDRPALVAHGVHLDGAELARLARLSAVLLHCPESNMNNAVGTSPAPAYAAAGGTVALGTDGVTYDMFQACKAAYFVHKLASGDPRAMGGDRMWAIATRGSALAVERLFGRRVGVLEPGAEGDLILLDYRPPTPLTAENLPWHIIFGMGSHLVTHTVVRGRLIMEDRQPLTLDPEAVAREASKRAQRLWERF